MSCTPSFTVVFQRDVESANHGKLVLTDTTDYAGDGIDLTNVIGYFRVGYPDGTYYLGSFASPDIDADVSLVFTLPIPKDANGDFMTGAYSFSYFTRISGGDVCVGDHSNEGNNYDFCPCVTNRSNVAPLKGAEACITYEVNCFCLKITGTDSTDVCTPTTDSKELTIYPPPSLGLASYSVSSATLAYNFQYTGGYELNVNRLLTYVNGIFTDSVRVESSVFIDVRCDRDLCALVSCYNTYRARILALANDLGGVTNLSKTDLSTWIRVLDDFNAHDHNLRCGNYEQAGVIYNNLKTLLDCDCGCSESDAPKLVNPYCSGTGSNNSVTIVEAGNTSVGVSANVVGDVTTYSITVSQALLDTITSLGTNYTTLNATVNSILAYTYSSYRLYYNNVTVASIGTGTSEQTLMTTNWPGAVLPTIDGDMIKITAAFLFPANSGFKLLTLYWGSTVNTFVIGAANITKGSAVLSMEIRRITATTQVITKNSSMNDVIGLTSEKYQILDSGSENMTGSVVIKASARNGVSSIGAITCQYMSIEIFKKG